MCFLPHLAGFGRRRLFYLHFHAKQYQIPSGSYFARIRVGGKLIRRSLETVVLSVAKLKLADLEKEERVKLENHQQFSSGKATLAIC